MHRKTLIALTALALATLSGCGKPAPAPEATASADAASAASSATTAWTPVVPAAGTYESTTSDGKPFSTVTVEADNSYSRVPVKGLREAGIVKITDGKLCFDPSGKEAATRCHTITAPAADGSFTATDEKGVTLNVKPVAK